MLCSYNFIVVGGGIILKSCQQNLGTVLPPLLPVPHAQGGHLSGFGTDSPDLECYASLLAQSKARHSFYEHILILSRLLD